MYKRSNGVVHGKVPLAVQRQQQPHAGWWQGCKYKGVLMPGAAVVLCVRHKWQQRVWLCQLVE